MSERRLRPQSVCVTTRLGLSTNGVRDHTRLRGEAMQPAVDMTSNRASVLNSDLARPALHELILKSTSGDGSEEQAWWRVRILMIHDGIVTRAILRAPARTIQNQTSDLPGDGEYMPWKGDGAWTPERDIWPIWHQRPDKDKNSAPLAIVNQHCRRNGER